MVLLTFWGVPVGGLGCVGPVLCLKRARALLRPSVLFLSVPRSNKIHPQNNSLANFLFSPIKRKLIRKTFRQIKKN